MKVVCLIPARLEATRFPRKLMQQLGSKTVIRSTYDNAVAMGIFDEVFVVTDNDEIFNEITSNGGKALRSTKSHESGSDRIAEAAENMDVDIVVNVQGDEPFTQKDLVQQMIEAFKADTGRETGVISAMQVLKDKTHIESPNYVKVVTDLNMNALYFSRNVIPFNVSSVPGPVYYEHIGLYAFRKEALLKFYALPVSPLEAFEKVECLRYLENGIRIKMILTDYMGIEIDTPEDLERAAKYLNP
jgi:3-deoxy-manno-octulosonate cytidylyltransferase (CMP-KDO synthetase)